MSARRQARGGGGRSRPDRDAVGSSPRMGPLVDVVVVVALAGAVLMLYAPVTGYDFINFDDRDYVTENPHVRAGLSWAGFRWALTGIRPRIGSVDVALAHARLAALRAQRRRASCHQRPPPCGEQRLPVRRLPGDDGCGVAERVRRGAVRAPPAPRRVGRLDRGAQGRAERPLLHASACAATGATSRGPGSAPGSCWR